MISSQEGNILSPSIPLPLARRKAQFYTDLFCEIGAVAMAKPSMYQILCWALGTHNPSNKHNPLVALLSLAFLMDPTKLYKGPIICLK